MDASVPISPPPPYQHAQPAQSVQPAQRPRHSDDWNVLRPEIERLYIHNSMKLKEVMRVMERKHGFFASYFVPLRARAGGG